MERELTVAVRAAKAAGAIAQSYFQKKKTIMHKGIDSLVTNADVAAEKAIIHQLKEAFPRHSFLAEESGRSGPVSDWQWLIDPIDGTTNYVWGWDNAFGVSIALAHNGIVQLGVIYFPSSDALFVAQKKIGTTKNGRKIKVSSRNDLRKSLLLFDAGFSARRMPICAALKEITKSVPKVRILGVATVEFSFIAQGFADCYVEFGTKPWDIAAGALLVEEAGGKVTDLAGKPWSPFSKHFVATNGFLHSKLLARLAQLL